MYQPSLQTHFNAPVGRDTLATIRGFGVRWCRIDAQTCDTATLVGMVEDVEAEDMVPLPIVYDLDRLRGVPAGLACEWGNEPDGDILPSTYRAQLDQAVTVAQEIGVSLWAPAISNLDRDSLRWLELVRNGHWPDGMAGVTVHRYGDGTFDYAHDGFASRAAEVEHLLTLCDGLPIMVTEFGYPTSPTALMNRRTKRTKFLHPDLHLSEDQQAANIAQEWDFWRAYTHVPFLYQINDGVNADEGYGLRRCAPDGTLLDWKPAAYQIPKEDAPMADTGTATYCISRARSFEMPGRPGEYHTYYPQGQTTTVLSVREDGSMQPVAKETAGAFETWKPSKDGNRAVFYETAEIYAIPLVD